MRPSAWTMASGKNFTTNHTAKSLLIQVTPPSSFCLYVGDSSQASPNYMEFRRPRVNLFCSILKKIRGQEINQLYMHFYDREMNKPFMT